MNVRELGRFRGYWSESAEYPDENFGNNTVYMPVRVFYRWANGRSKMTFDSVFRAFIGAGPEDGRVDIDDSPKATIDEFHLQFRPAFQDYQYDGDDHSLVISDESDKMGGRYEVRITPLIEEP